VRVKGARGIVRSSRLKGKPFLFPSGESLGRKKETYYTKATFASDYPIVYVKRRLPWWKTERFDYGKTSCPRPTWQPVVARNQIV
jgi:hypothetical protein